MNRSEGVFLSVIGVCSQAGRDATPVKVNLDWSSDNPAQVNLRIIQRDVAPVDWQVARTGFIAASVPSLRGAWTGRGGFSVCHRDLDIMFAFKPLQADRAYWAFVRVPADPILAFIEDTQQVVPSSGEVESQITLAAVDAWLAEVFA